MNKRDLLKINDILVIYPLRGRKTTYNLNRGQYFFKSSTQSDLGYEDFVWKIPVLSGESASVKLFYDELIGGYRLNSDGDVCVNGTYGRHFLLQRGDVLRIGLNRLSFMSGENREEVVFSSVPQKVIQSDLSVVIEGETGTGKSRLARQIHEKSGVSGNFVQLNLSSFSDSLIESELFGHKKGAFTGALNDSLGAIDEARGGTLFLDEIDSIGKELQVKLLLFLDDQKYRVVGGREMKGRCRLIFSSGTSLEKLLSSGKMREDFYYRIVTQYRLKLSPLRQRSDLLNYLIDQFSFKEGVYLSSSLRKHYLSYSWPGNIRQLLNHLKLKKVLAVSNRLELEAIDDFEGPTGGQFNAEFSMKQIKQSAIKKTLRDVNGSIKLAAEVLDVSPGMVKSYINSK